MAQLLLVRHAQASFGADDYDQLSPLGERQSLRLGQYIAQHQGLLSGPFDAVYTGTLKRHAQTLAGIAAGSGLALDAQRCPGLNEYDSHAVVHAIHPAPLPPSDTPERFKQHFRLLRDGLKAWMDGVVSPQGMPSYADFSGGVRDVLADIRTRFGDQRDARILLVSSGGPISTAVGLVLGTTPETTIELNLRIRNTSVTEFVVTPKRMQLLTFNTLPHLDDAEHRDWVTST